MTRPALTLRYAELRDARALAELAEATFRATFGAMNSAAHMARHCRDSYGEAIQAGEIADPARLTWLCEDGGQLVGYAQLHLGPAPPCVAAARPGEIQRLYVRADWHGGGAGAALMRASLDSLQVRGADIAWLGVWEHNPRAIAFYRKWGFTPVGEHVFPLGGDPQRDLVLARALQARP